MMWLLGLLRANWRLLAVVAIVTSAIGVYSFWLYGNGKEAGLAEGNAKLVKMYEAGQKAVQRRDEAIQHNLEIYREDLAAVAARKPKRVFLCPNADVPQGAGGTGGADPAGADSRDYGPLLREAREALIRCQTLIEVVK